MLEEILAEYEGTLIVVSHDRDFLDQTVTKILAFEGEGQVEGYIGGYSDYLAARKPKPGTAPVSQKQEKAKPVEVAPAAPVKKLSYKLQYELDQLPNRMQSLEAEINALEDVLSDNDLYARDPVTFQNSSRRLGQAREELELAETRWLELEEMKAALT